jgi:uncharacterized membrane protein
LSATLTAAVSVRRRKLLAENGQAMALFVVLLALVLVPMAAFVIDIADAFALRRHLQASADAAALAAASESVPAAAMSVACEYSAEQERPDGTPIGVNECEPLGVLPGRNSRTDGPEVDTHVDVLSANRVRVTQSATSHVFFGGIFGFDGFDVSADAEAALPAPPASPGPPALVE